MTTTVLVFSGIAALLRQKESHYFTQYSSGRIVFSAKKVWSFMCDSGSVRHYCILAETIDLLRSHLIDPRSHMNGLASVVSHVFFFVFFFETCAHLYFFPQFAGFHCGGWMCQEPCQTRIVMTDRFF